MRLDGNCAISTEISSVTVHSRHACSKPGTSNFPSSLRKASRLIEARLHAVSSRNMYSEHGLDALIRPLAGQVCHSLIVVSYCTPGSAEAQAAYAIFSHKSRAFRVLAILPSVRRVRCQSPSETTRSMKSLSSRTELFEFWPETVK